MLQGDACVLHGEAWVASGRACVPQGGVGVNQGNALLLQGGSGVHLPGAPSHVKPSHTLSIKASLLEKKQLPRELKHPP